MKLKVNTGYVMIERQKVDAHGILLPYDKREVSGNGDHEGQPGEQDSSGVRPWGYGAVRTVRRL